MPVGDALIDSSLQRLLFSQWNWHDPALYSDPEAGLRRALGGAAKAGGGGDLEAGDGARLLGADAARSDGSVPTAAEDLLCGVDAAVAKQIGGGAALAALVVMYWWWSYQSAS